MSETPGPAPNQTLPQAADPTPVHGGRPPHFLVRRGQAVARFLRDVDRVE